MYTYTLKFKISNVYSKKTSDYIIANDDDIVRAPLLEKM